MSLDSFDTRAVLARTLWAEARSQGVQGMIAVANVIANRAANPGWWGHDLRSVCLAPSQFSCWNADDPQAAKIRAAVIPGPLYMEADALAQAAMLDALRDLTGGADHYVAEYALADTKWAKGQQAVYACGVAGTRHFFFSLGIGG